MILSKEEFLEKIKQIVGEDTTEESLGIIEDFTDTYNHLEELSSGQEDWKAKYEENDKAWRQKYRDRFFSNDTEETIDEGLEDEDDEPLTFDDLFEERED